MEKKNKHEHNNTQQHESEQARPAHGHESNPEHTDVSNITSEGSRAGIPATERTIGNSTKKGVTGSDYDGQVAP